MSRVTVALVGVLAASGAFTAGRVIAARAADLPPVKPEWQKVFVPDGEVVVFGDVLRPGYYALRPQGMTLKQLVVSAGMPRKAERASALVRRHTSKVEAVEIELKLADVLGGGGVDLALEPNDTVQVRLAKAAE